MIKTILVQAALAYAIAEEPGPILITQPTDSDAITFSKERLTPMLNDCPTLAGKISPAKSRDGSNSATYKDFAGGTLSIVGANSPSNAARRTIRYLFCDEINKYPDSAGDEGTFIELAEERTAPFGSRAKKIYACSPTVTNKAISRKFDQSDQRKPWVPCHECGERQILKWLQVKWDQTAPAELRASTAWYECEHCRARWNDLQRWRSVEQTEWRAEKPFRGVAGFWISHLYGTKPLAEIVQKFLNAEATGDVNDLKVFINTNLAEEWVEKGAAPDHDRLLDRREDYLGSVPKGVLLVTAGVDVHPDRLEVEVVGWGRRRENWSLDYLIFDGKPTEPEVWQKLELLLGEVFVSEDGQEMPISRMFVDSGHATNEVYSWVRTQNSNRVVAIKGEHRGLLPVGPPSPVDVTISGKKIKHGLKIRTVQVSFFKSEFYADLSRRKPTDEEIARGVSFPAGYCHFPKDGNYGEEHFKQICAEHLVTRRDRRGRERQEWEQLRARNEALDCRIYARAAAWDLGMDRFKEQHWAELEQRYAPMPVVPAAEPEVVTPPDPEQTQGDLLEQAKPQQPVRQPIAAAGSIPRPPAPVPGPVVESARSGWLGERTRGWFSR